MTNPTLWNQILIWPIINVLVACYKFFEWLGIPGPMGFAIILLTVVIRLALYPLMHKQMESARKMAKLKPHLDELTKRHKGDKTKLQQAQLELYKSHGVNPAAGCLPMLVQLPVLIALYNVFYQVLNNGNLENLLSQINQVLYTPFLRVATLDLSFLGINLGVKPSQYQEYGVWLLTIPVLTAGLQWYQTKLMTDGSKQQTASDKKLVTSDKKQEETGKKQEDTAAEMQKQMTLIAPLMIGFFAFQFPVGLALYWNIFSAFGIMQQVKVNKQ